MNITFTLDQVNNLLNALSQVPYMYSNNIIQGIHQVVTPQLPKPEETPAETPAETPEE